MGPRGAECGGLSLTRESEQRVVIVAFVPMRHESERVPGKNYRDLAGKPLYCHIVETLLACREIDEVVIDTDSRTILNDAAKRYPAVRLLERPNHLCGGHTPMNEVLLNDVRRIEADYYLQTHSTNPLLSSETISRAIQAFLNSGKHDCRAVKGYSGSRKPDSLFGVTRWQTRLYWADGRAINHNPNELLRTQDLPPVYEENSNLYLFTRDVLERRGHRIGERPLMYEIDAEEAWDIDEETDFRIAEFLMWERLAQTKRT